MNQELIHPVLPIAIFLNKERVNIMKQLHT